MSLCRACLSSDKDLLEPDQNFKCNYNLLTNLEVTLLDGKSQSFCKTCVEAVNFFIQFRNQCISSETTLQELYSQHDSKSNELFEYSIKSEELDDKTDTKIKEEIKFEVDFEDPDPEYDDDNSHNIKTEDVDIQLDKSTKQTKKRKTAYTKVKKCKSISEVTAKKNAKRTCDIQLNISKKPTKKRKSAYTKVKKCKSISEVTAKQNAKRTCGLCSKTFDCAVTFRDHLEGHKGDRACALCPMNTFEHWPQLLAHGLAHTLRQRCHLCDKAFRSPPHMELHYREVHCGEKDILLGCSLCPSKFSKPIRLTKHVWAKHSAKRYICDFCSKVFNNKQLLKSHIVGHSAVKRYSCDLCDYSSKYACGLSAHKVRKHVSDKRICKLCERIFMDSEKLARHTCVDRSNICPVCGKELRKGFARHLALHGEEKRFKCSRCPAAYRTRGALAVHADRHDGTPRHRCDTCRRTFYSRPVLLKHIRVHTGEKPYACSKCNMRFTGGNNLKVHMKVHGELLVVKRTPPEVTV